MWEETKEGKKRGEGWSSTCPTSQRPECSVKNTWDMQLRKTSDGEETYKYNLYYDTELLSIDVLAYANRKNKKSPP